MRKIVLRTFSSAILLSLAMAALAPTPAQSSRIGCLWISSPEATYIEFSTDDWIKESWVVPVDPSSLEPIGFEIDVYNHYRPADPVSDVILVIAINEAGYEKIESVSIDGTTFTISDFTLGTPAFHSGDSMPTHGVYPTWFAEYTIGTIGADATVSRAVTVTLKTGVTWDDVKVHFDAHGKDNNGDDVFSPFSHDLTVAANNNNSIEVTKWYTYADEPYDPLPTDPTTGLQRVDVVIVSSGPPGNKKYKIASTNPGEIMAWVQVENIGGLVFRSLEIADTLPNDWNVHPEWDPAKGGIHVYLVSDGISTDITVSATITSDPGTREVTVSLASIYLQPGDRVQVSIKLKYALKGTEYSSDPSGMYPIIYTNTATATAYAEPNYSGTSTSDTGSADLIAYKKP